MEHRGVAAVIAVYLQGAVHILCVQTTQVFLSRPPLIAKTWTLVEPLNLPKPAFGFVHTSKFDWNIYNKLFIFPTTWH